MERSYFQAWDRSRFELTHLATYGDQSAAVFKKVLIFAGALVRLLGLLALWRPDIVHIHFSWRGSFQRKAIVVSIVRALGARNIVMHCHAGRFPLYWSRASDGRRRRIRRVLGRANLVLVLADIWRRFFEDNQVAARVRVLPNPLSRLPSDAGAPAPKQAPIILFLGELGENKGTYDIVAAAPRLLRCDPQAEIWLVGGGDLEGVRDLIERHSWSSRVRLPGWLDGIEKQHILRRASLFLLPSYNEGLPMAILEAMAYGLPVVASCVGAIPEVIRDGEEGFLIEPGDVDAIVDRVRRLLENRTLARRMGRKARERVRERFEARRILDELYAIYDELLDEEGEKKTS